MDAPSSRRRKIAIEGLAPARKQAEPEGPAAPTASFLIGHGYDIHRLQAVVDLGCAPGGWTQVAVTQVGTHGKIVGIDLNPTDPIAGATLLTGDFRDPATAAAIHAALGGPADLVLSDMAAPATGHAATDHLRIVALAEDAYAFAVTILKPGGAFVAKVFQGGSEGSLLAALKRDFAELRHAKPAASRAESAETYVVAKGFRGGA